MIDNKWTIFLDRFEKRINNDQVINTFKEKTNFFELINDSFYIIVEDEEYLEFYKNNFSVTSKEILEEIYEKKINVEFIKRADVDKIPKQKKESGVIGRIQNLDFEDYEIGEFNKVAFTLFKNILDTDTAQFNPIFLYSHTGLGKTHLLSAFARKYVEKYENKSIMYIDSQEFIKKLSEIFSRKKPSNFLEIFKNEFSNVDILIIEDIQFLSDKTKMNEIFFTIYNNLIVHNKIIIMTSDRTPEKLDGFEDRMISRFSSGIIVKISDPETEILKSILENKLKKSKIQLSTAAVNKITNFFYKDIRKLLGIINNIMIYVLHSGKTIVSEEDVMEILDLQHIAKKNNQFELHINPQTIINTVSKIYGIKSQDIIGKSRKKEVVNARHVAAYILRTHVGMSFGDIGSFMSNRNHSTMISAVENVKSRCESDEDLKNMINSIIKKI